MSRAMRILLMLLALACLEAPAHDEDNRLHSAPYSSDEIYHLRGYAGYQIDLEFEQGEHFIGLGTGDVEGIAYESQDNHLFIKPKALNVRTNLTVLTSRRTYHFDYVVAALHNQRERGGMVFALRFQYPQLTQSSAAAAATDQALLAAATASDRRNADYWFCGSPEIQPLSAWDEGVHTHIRFDTRSELPVLFVRNDDDTESLLNFNVDHDEVIVHRVARRFIVRRGKLVGCIVNRGYGAARDSLRSGTLSPAVERGTRAPGPP